VNRPRELTPSILASSWPLVTSVSNTSSPKQAARMRPSSLRAMLPPEYMGWSVRSTENVVLTAVRWAMVMLCSEEKAGGM